MAIGPQLNFDIISKYNNAGVDKAEKGLKSLSKVADREGKEGGKSYAIGFTKQVEPLGGRVSGIMKSSLGKVAGLGAGLVAGGAFASAFGEALAAGDAQAKLQGQLGLTDKQAAKAGRISGDLYQNNFGESVGTVNDTIRKVIQDTNLTMRSLNLKPITAGIITITDTFEQETGQVTRAAGQLVRTGLAKTMSGALNIITGGFQKGADKSEDFLDSLNEYSTLFRNMGVSGAKATGLLVQGLQAGARDSDIVADAIKEFSIRAVDGSKLTAQGFSMVGLNAGKMAAAIGKGGKSSSKALDTVLDRLRGIEDPVKRSRAAVALFGTQAEDLGQALFALDPSKATRGLGKLEGRARGLVDVIGGTANAKIQSFIRTLKQGFVESIGAAIKAFVDGEAKGKGFVGFMSRLGATARKLADGFQQHVLPSIKAVIGFIGDNTGLVKGLTIAIGSLVLVTKAHAAAMKVQAAGGLLSFMTSYIKATKLATSATKAQAAAQALLNVVMKANPIIKVISIVTALGAAVVTAYKKSETFRGIVDGVFRVIGKVGKWLWERALKPAFSAIGKAFTAVGKTFMSVWDHIIRPVFGFLVDKFTWVVGSILDGAAKLFGWVPGIGPKLRSAADKFQAFRDRVNNALDGVRDRTVTITTRADVPAGVSVRALMEGRGLAAGGMVHGPGGPRDDKIPARLSNGEFVVNAASTKRHRALLEAINAKGFANGGMVRAEDGSMVPRSFYGSQGLVSVRGRTDGTRELGMFARQFNRGLGWLAKSMGKGLLSALKSAVPSVSGVPSSVSGNAAIVKSIFSNMFGWGRYWPQTYSLLMKESGFRNTAQNPTSSAYGMFQFLDSTWGGYGIPKTSDPRLQTIAGGRYIRARYGNPAAALAFHLRNNWYDKGGILKSGGIAGNKSGKPERILSPRQTNAFERLVDALTGGMKQSDAPLAKQLKNLHRTITDIAKLLRKADRDAMARRLSDPFRKRIANLLKRRERLDERLEKAREKRDRIVSRRREVSGGLRSGILEGRNLVGGFGIDIDGGFSAGDLLGGLQANLAKARKFQGLLRSLRKKGFGGGIIAQLAAAGPEEGFTAAEALAGAQGGQVGQINKTFGAIGKTAGQFSQEMGRKLFGAGQKAAQGLVDGLRSKLASVQKIMARIARMMVRSLRKALDMRSPSRVMEKLGALTGDGYTGGLAASMAKAPGVMDGAARDVRRTRVRPVPRGHGERTVNFNLTFNGVKDASEVVKVLRHEIKTNRTLRRELGLAR